MAIFGSLIALAAALAFVAIVALSFWGTLQAVSDELLRGFISANPSATDRALTLLLVGVPLAGVAALGLLSAVRLTLVALGMG
ncbi:MAG: hypothetical protein HGA19_16935 [Oscillochloris sp.]|nr:hypothetical protein [Oscillochloris sp.]